MVAQYVCLSWKVDGSVLTAQLSGMCAAFQVLMHKVGNGASCRRQDSNNMLQWLHLVSLSTGQEVAV